MPKRDRRPGPTSNDVEIQRIKARYDLWKLIVVGVFAVLGILALALPIDLLQPMVNAVAGHTTDIKVDGPLEGATGLSVVVNIGQFARGKGRKREVQRLRDRADRLEIRLGLSPLEEPTGE